jgi:hypothetical protein
MTVTLKPWMAALTIAVLCALLGFAVGQVTTASSAKDATSSALPATYWLKQMDRSLDNIEDDANETCRAVSGRDWYCN